LDNRFAIDHIAPSLRDGISFLIRDRATAFVIAASFNPSNTVTVVSVLTQLA